MYISLLGHPPPFIGFISALFYLFIDIGNNSVFVVTVFTASKFLAIITAPICKGNC